MEIAKDMSARKYHIGNSDRWLCNVALQLF